MPSTHFTFTTIRIEGAILPPDLLQRIADGDPNIDGLAPESYHLAPGEKVNEATNRAWNRALGAWATFKARADKLPEIDPGTTITREHWLLPLFAELGYGRLTTTKAIEIEGESFPVSHGWQNTPIHLVGCRVDPDKRTAGVAGAARSSPHSLVQVLLNRSDAHLWAYLSNGLRFRILRDNASLTRQAYVEFDLQAMMEGQVYSDFVLLWLLCHESRVEAQRPEDCWLEKWSRMAQEQGTRALDQLRTGVEEAISALGRGFLAHSANKRLRDRLYAGTLDAQDYYRQLLRLVYRLIFLFVAEDRGLLLDPDADADARNRYTRYYATAKLRTLAERRIGTRHSDLYCGVRLIMDKLGNGGYPDLALPALGGFLFSPLAIPDLTECQISNYDLLDAVRALVFTTDRRTRRVVDYKNLGAEELGSVYESLLELHPVINATSHTFELKSASGNERKTTGSFYTPTPLINVLLDSALDPVLDEACKKPEAEQAILELKVCDSASGSGHFLVAAAHRIARRLATIRTGDDEPAPDALRTALRDVIGHSLYGVDVNPDAVELCKVSLWMEALEPGKPLSFLDNHIKCGNSLIGVMPGLDTSEIPDDAFTAVTGDDKKIATALKKRNKTKPQPGQRWLTGSELETIEDLARWMAKEAQRLNGMPEGEIDQVQAKEAEYRRFVESEQYARPKLEADLWTAAFFWRIQDAPGALKILAPTQAELTTLRSGGHVPPELIRGVQELAQRLRFFHWGLEFPEVFERGGFDCVLSNPPWERIKLQEEEFFAARDPQIATAPNKAARQKLIDALPAKNLALARDFENAKHDAEATSKFVHESGRFPLTAVGDVNTYALFAESATLVISGRGIIGIIIPSGIATDDTNKKFFQSVVGRKALTSLYSFDNSSGIFPAVKRSTRFCLLTMLGTKAQSVTNPDFIFYAREITELRFESRHFELSAKDIELLNPNTLTCPAFRTKDDANIAKRIYHRVPILCRETPFENPWGILIRRVFDMNKPDVLALCEPATETVPRSGFSRMYEAKLMGQFDHRERTYAMVNGKFALLGTNKQDPNVTVSPRYFVRQSEVEKRIVDLWSWNWLIAWQDVTDVNTMSRTTIACILPRVGTDFTLRIGFPSTNPILGGIALPANFNALIFDYLVRQMLGGLHLSDYIVKQLPVLPPTAYTPDDIDFIAPRVLELVYTAWDVKPFAEDMGYHGEPFRWDEERRAHLRAELDAYYARLYGLTRDELRYILDPQDVYGEAFPGETFRVLKEKEIKQYGEYRTRRLVLEKWDEMVG